MSPPLTFSPGPEGEHHKNTAMTYAAGAGNIGFIQILLNQGHRPVDASPLLQAVLGGHLDCLRLLLTVTDPNALSASGLRPLSQAFASADMAFPLALIEAGADPCLRDGSGSDSLIWAASSSNPAMARLALRYCDPAWVDESGRDALMTAAVFNRLDTVRLLAPVSDLSRKDSSGHSASDLTRDPEIIEHLRSIALSIAESDALSGDTPGALGSSRTASL